MQSPTPHICGVSVTALGSKGASKRDDVFERHNLLSASITRIPHLLLENQDNQRANNHGMRRYELFSLQNLMHVSRLPVDKARSLG